MNKFEEGQNVWWLIKSNSQGFIAATIQEAIINGVEKSGFYKITNGAGCGSIAIPDDLFPTKKDALNAAIRVLQERLFNE